ncbi:MAG: MarR family winged helix-turn-helix transcriptional regulator [Hyphomonadaceae bacterium]
MSAARDSVRLSLRLLSTGREIERRVDQMMRARFDSTIARFDFMAALDRFGVLSLGGVSEHLLVSNGNVTALAARLRADGLIETAPSESDRRVQMVRLTDAGAAAFKKMARAHEACVSDLLNTLTRAERASLMALLERARASIRGAEEREAVR